VEINARQKGIGTEQDVSNWGNKRPGAKFGLWASSSGHTLYSQRALGTTRCMSLYVSPTLASLCITKPDEACATIARQRVSRSPNGGICVLLFCSLLSSLVTAEVIFFLILSLLYIIHPLVLCFSVRGKRT
jgi:hypothetical protein